MQISKFSGINFFTNNPPYKYNKNNQKPLNKDYSYNAEHIQAIYNLAFLGNNKNPVVGIDFDCNIKEYEDIYEASKKTGLSRKRIELCLGGEYLQINGLAFAKKSDIADECDNKSIDLNGIINLWKSAFGEEATCIIYPDGSVKEYRTRKKAADAVGENYRIIARALNAGKVYETETQGAIVLKSDNIMHFVNGKRVIDDSELEKIQQEYFGAPIPAKEEKKESVIPNITENKPEKTAETSKQQSLIDEIKAHSLVLIDENGNITPCNSRAEASNITGLSPKYISNSAGSDRHYVLGYIVIKSSEILTKDKEGNDKINGKEIERLWGQTFGKKIIYSIGTEGKLEKFPSADEASSYYGVSKNSVSQITKHEAVSALKKPQPLTFIKAKDITVFDENGNASVDYRKVEEIYKKALGDIVVCAVDKDTNILEFTTPKEISEKFGITIEKARALYKGRETRLSTMESFQFTEYIFVKSRELIKFAESGKKYYDRLEVNKLSQKLER